MSGLVMLLAGGLFPCIAAAQAATLGPFRIVDNDRPLHGIWQVVPRPILVIGLVTGDERYTFADIAGAVFRPDGGIIVADRGWHQVRSYDINGRFERAGGREGGGPLEFRTMVGPLPCFASGFVIRDPANQKYVRLDASGVPISARRDLIPSGWSSAAAEVACSGRNVLHLSRQRRTGLPVGPWRSTARAALTDSDGKILRDLGEWPGQDRQRFANSDGPLQFGRTPVIGLTDSVILIGTGDSAAFHLIATDGSSNRLVRWRQSVLRFTDADLAAFKAELESRAPDPRLVTQYLNQQFHRPDRLPPYSAVVTDGEGNFWVQQYLKPSDSATVVRIFRPDGQWLSQMTIPARFTLYAVASDRVMGRTVDARGVHKIHVYQYRKR